MSQLDQNVKLRINDEGKPEWDWGELPKAFGIIMESCTDPDQINKPIQCLKIVLTSVEEDTQKRPNNEYERFLKETASAIFKEENPRATYKTDKKIYGTEFVTIF